MPKSQSTALPLRGQFRIMYNALKRARLLAQTPIIFCEGDSWFSTPLAMNLLDWIVSPAPEDEARGVPLFGKGGLFFRAERSGDHASYNQDKPKKSMFTKKNIDDLMSWYTKFEFDMVLLSAGGNDFVDKYLERTLGDRKDLSVDEAYQCVLDGGKYEQVCAAYDMFVGAVVKAKADVKILAHTYAYPVLIGQQGKLTVMNTGAAALLKKSVGPWIGKHLEGAIRLTDAGDEHRAFVRRLMDGFEEHVLREMKSKYPVNFDYVDLRKMLPDDEDWFDEMHPTEAGFHKLASAFRGEIIDRLPAAKK